MAGLPGLLTAFLGTLVGLSLLLIPYLLGGMGGGDIKALAAMGSLLGPSAIFQVFLYTGLIGGLLAVLHYAFSRNLIKKCAEGLRAMGAFVITRDLDCIKPEKSEQLRFPYAAAIAFGFFCYTVWGGIFSLL